MKFSLIFLPKTHSQEQMIIHVRQCTESDATESTSRERKRKEVVFCVDFL